MHGYPTALGLLPMGPTNAVHQQPHLQELDYGEPEVEAAISGMGQVGTGQVYT